MVLLLTDEDVRGVVTMNICLEVIEQAFRELGDREAINRPRSDVTVQHPTKPDYVYRFKSMDGVLPKSGVAALRVNSDVLRYSVVGGLKRQIRVAAAKGTRFVEFLMLFDTENGEPISIMASGYLQKMRVGATSGIGAKYLARQDSAVLGLLGSGWQASAQLMALCAVRPIRIVKVYSPNPEHRRAFAEEMSGAVGLEVRPVDTPGEALKGADIISAATNSLQPVFEAEALEEGAHLTSVLWAEVPNEAFKRAAVVVLNSRPLGSRDTDIHDYVLGDLPYLYRGQQRDIDWSKTPELGELIIGKARGRSDGRQITFHVNNIGLGIQFAAVGAKVYELAKNAGLGKEIAVDFFVAPQMPWGTA